MADRYKWIAKLFFIVQLLVSWAIVVVSTLYASWQDPDDCTDGENCAWWITALGETVFGLTVVASFLISFDSYINAKV